MENKEAIVLLKSIVVPPDIEIATKTKKFYDALDVAIAALEKRTPKRDMQKNQYNHNLFSVRCPSCSAHLGTYNKRLNQFTYTHFEWCPYCGQAIDWSEPNTE